MYTSKICSRCLRLSQELRHVRSLRNLQPRRYAATFTQIREDLLSRQLPVVYDYWEPLKSQLLRAALIDFLPPQERVDEVDPPFPSDTFPRSTFLQPGFHLIYFPPATRESELLPDGTDPLQWPGEPYVRRMWAGGSIQFNIGKAARLRGSRGACVERITEVVTKGKPGEEKIFINLERRMGTVLNQQTARKLRQNNDGKRLVPLRRKYAARVSPETVREFLSTDQNCCVIENRSIVFMRESTSKAPQLENEQAPSKILKAALTPDFTHTLVPSPTLLYRFSGLTFNAHRIHLDKEYCRQIEHHRGLLVHGPLSLVIMMQVAKQYLINIQYVELGAAWHIDSVEYRNLAPLYAEEPMTVCVCKTGDTKLEVWVQGPEGGVAVKGTVRLQLPEALFAESTKSEEED